MESRNLREYINKIDTLKDLPILTEREGLLRFSLAGGILEMGMVNNYMHYRFQKELSAKPAFEKSLNKLNLLTVSGAHKIDDTQSQGKYIYVFENMVFIRDEVALTDIKQWDIYARNASRMAIDILEEDDEEIAGYMLMDYEGALDRRTLIPDHKNNCK